MVSENEKNTQGRDLRPELVLEWLDRGKFWSHVKSQELNYEALKKSSEVREVNISNNLRILL